MTQAPWFPSTPTGMPARLRIADPLRGDVEGIGVDMSDRPLSAHEQKHTINGRTVKAGGARVSACASGSPSQGANCLRS